MCLIATGSFPSTLFIAFALPSSSVLGKSLRQNGHVLSSRSFLWCSLLAYEQPPQIVLLQHENKVDFFESIESGKKQIGQSPIKLLLGCRNKIVSRKHSTSLVLADCLIKISSRNSAARSLQFASCCGKWSSLHPSLQYRTDRKHHSPSIWCHQLLRCRMKHSTSFEPLPQYYLCSSSSEYYCDRRCRRSRGRQLS